MQRNLIAFFVVLLFSSTIYAVANPTFILTPKIGVELGNRTLKWQEGLGKDHFTENLPQLDLFIELPIIEQFSLRFGHGMTTKRRGLVGYADDSYILNYFNQAGALNYLTETKLTANYIDAIYNYTLLQKDDYKLQFLAFLGASKTKLQLRQHELTLQNINTGFDFDNLTTDKKICIRKGIGLQYVLDNGISFKLGVTHERTTKLKSSAPVYVLGALDGYYNVEAKNSIIYSLGIVYQIPTI